MDERQDSNTPDQATKISEEVLSILAQQLTQTGTMLGTPAYMAPEQLRRLPADARGDQFSFCVALYEAVHGVRPFDGSTGMIELVAGVRPRFEPAWSHTGLPKVPLWLRRVLMRGMAADKEARFASMDDLLATIQRLLRRERGAKVIVVATLGLAAAGVGIGQYAEADPPRCDGASALLAGIWDEDGKHKVQDAILGTQLSYAADTWGWVERRLDDYAKTWVSKHTEACEATRVSQEQTEEVMTLRMECLSSRRIELQAVVRVLALADKERLQEAAELVLSLHGLSRCDDVEALRAELPPPEDPQVAEQVGVERARLEEARALDDIGDHASSETVAQAVVEQAEGIDYGPLQAEAFLRRGKARLGVGDYDDAEKDLKQALLLAMQYEHHLVQLNALTVLTHAVGDSLGTPEQGQQWGTMALALAQRRSATDDERALVHNALGALELRRGGLDEALDHYQRQLTIEQRDRDPNDPVVGQCLANIGVVLVRQGKLDEALVQAQRALSIGEAALGPRHPKLTVPLEAVGTVLLRQGRLDEALPYFQRSLSIDEDALGPRHPKVGKTLNNIGIVLVEQGKQTDALVYLRRGLSIKEGSLGSDNPQLSSTLKNIGRVFIDLGELDDAQAHLERALAIEQASLGLSTSTSHTHGISSASCWWSKTSQTKH